MSLLEIVFRKRIAVYLGLLAAAAVLVCRSALADSGPIIINVNPQGTVTAASVKITLETEDLALCRYSTSDTDYDRMGNDLDTPDGLYHSAAIGSLNKGAYTYYVRCKDFEGNANGASATAKFNVGEIGCLGENCPTVNPSLPPAPSGDTAAPVLTGFLPTGTTYNNYAVLSVSTNEAASCRYSWFDKAYEAMTLPFSTSNKLYHTASAQLSNLGYYSYYVRCQDVSGNVNQVAGRISFRYASNAPAYVAPKTTPAAVVTPADTAPPAISVPEPSGEITTAAVKISCVTDEAATCRYGKTDIDYDSLSDAMDDDGTRHSKEITLDAPGEYTYYVRCKDEKNNKNTASSKISFNYAAPGGPEISDLQPTGAIFQNNVALIVTTDKPADCRYSDSDIDFDQMGDSFDTNDGSLHQATVDLPDYGPYAYYVRCRDKNGNKDDKSETINFEYKNPDQPSAEETVPPPAATPTPPAITCEETKNSDGKDGVCDKTADCICDLDCPAGSDQADPDCANVVSPPANNGWIAVLLIGLILLVVVVIIIVIIKRRGSAEEEDVELP